MATLTEKDLTKSLFRGKVSEDERVIAAAEKVAEAEDELEKAKARARELDEKAAEAKREAVRGDVLRSLGEITAKESRELDEAAKKLKADASDAADEGLYLQEKVNVLQEREEETRAAVHQEFVDAMTDEHRKWFKKLADAYRDCIEPSYMVHSIVEDARRKALTLPGPMQGTMQAYAAGPGGSQYRTIFEVWLEENRGYL